MKSVNGGPSAFLAACMLLFGVTSGSLAAKYGHRRYHRPGVFQTYDENKDGVLDKKERDKIRRDLNEDERLERYDKDGDRKLTDEEIDAIKPADGKKGGKSAPKKA